ncbi:MAG: tetratricopeptide repeat protein [Myxococcota bacterium]|nr:tetratricopeptide repeat protein [Myxococcota bacterium]
MGEPDIIRQALEAIQGDDLDAARTALLAALTEHPERIDLVHSLSIIELQSGRPEQALDLVEKGAAVLKERNGPGDAKMIPLLLLSAGAACEEMGNPEHALEAYEQILTLEPGHPLATQGKGHLLLAWGQLDAGLETLQSVVDAQDDDPRFLEATAKLIAGVRAFLADDLHPRNFIDAHRGTYCEFFTHHADRTAADGWIAEAARMRRDETGTLVPTIAEGARPYAATRVDLVDPATGQAGLVGDEPMIAAIGGHEIIAQAPIVFEWPHSDLRVWGSSQTPWNLLNISVVFDEAGGVEAALRQLDVTIGDWYTAGFNGAFGSQDRGRFHNISDPIPCGDRGARYDIDCGRAEARAVDDLLNRLAVLHASHSIRTVMIGRGFAPAG